MVSAWFRLSVGRLQTLSMRLLVLRHRSRIETRRISLGDALPKRVTFSQARRSAQRQSQNLSRHA
jgi:hypothetical protein